MASDSDGSTSSAVVLNSICEKLVEYKESLLRQLVDEREAALAASKEQQREDVQEEQAEIRSAEEEETAPPVEQQAQAEAVAEVEVKVIADDLKPMDDVESSVPVVESPVETEAASVAAAVEPVEKPSPAKATEDEVVLKKRRLAEAEEVESAAVAHKDDVPVKKAKRSKAKTLRLEKQNVDSSSEHTSEKDSTMVNATGEQEAVLVGAPYRVVRTSVPPNKYLMQKRRDEEASDREALVQPVLRSSTPGSSGLSTCNGATGTKRPASTHRSSSSSADVVNAEFERRLRESMSLRREVNQRCVSVTRKRQLPRLPTPARDKSHWDFLLEEMKWMATDFAQERNWKRVMQRRLVADVLVAQNAESVRQEQENRQIARGVALQVSAFWRTMERIAARSRVRFEAAGTESSSQGDADDPMLGDHRSEDDGNRGKIEDHNVAAVAGDILSLKYHTIDVAAGKEIDAKGEGRGAAKADTVLKAAKSHISYIVAAGKRARSAMSSSMTDGSIVGDKSSCPSLREAAFRELQARCTALQAKGGPTIILAAFQLLALRWMLELYSSGLNIFLNDQLGMGKAATIVAFLSLIEIVSFQKQQLQSQEENPTNTATPETLRTGPLIGPHLILVSDEELHKWRYYLRIWHPDRRIQLYDGVGSSVSCRKQLQREWKIKPRAHAHKSEDDFLIAPPNHDDGDDLDDDERAEPLYCVLCPVNAFYEDREAFVQFNHWQMVVVENELGGHFDDPACVTALQQLRQQQRRVLCNGQPIENWKNTALRLQYAEFMVREAPRLESDSGSDSNQHRVETWPVQELLVERSSVGEVMQLYGKSSSVRASLWKATSQQEDTSQHMSALLLALSCLSLRRVRSEVETQLGKIEEISVSCQPSPSQKTQYRNALSGFGATLDTSGGREERLGVWLQLLLRLREICNCVDIVNDMDKLGHADLRLLTSCSAKLEALEPLLRRLAVQEGKKVVIYCQFNAMLPIMELFLSLLDIHFVRVTGSVNMQRRALCHFADRPVVRVALVSTRLSMSNGRWAASVFGGEAIIVVDSDWNATCDAKLRASWAKMAVGGADTLPVYRLHCENTVEASLLRVGASLTERVFGEMNPQELLAVPSDMALSMAIEKPSWWSSTATSSGGNGLSNSGTIASLSSVAQQVERDGRYCGGSSELEMPLVVHNVDLDAEEHLLLANTDELTPVEWYAVNYVHGVTDKKHQQRDNGKTVERDVGRTEEDCSASWDDNSTLFHSDQCSFEEMAASEVNRQWQDGDATSQLFYKMESGGNGLVDENTLEKLFMQMRMEGMETHFDVYKPPQPPLPEGTSSARLSSEAGPTVDNQMTFRVAYRVPAPPPPQPQPGKSKVEHGVGQHGDLSKLKSSKKQRTSAAAMSAARAGMAPGAGSANATAASAGVKRKLESQLGGIKSGPLKEQRVDLEGIPVPDVSEFADDDFWGDTNLDALDSAEWDDPALSGILGAGVGTGNGASSTASSSGTASSGAGVSATLGGSGADAGVHGEAGHSKTGSQKGFKKSKNATGRARKSSMSSDSGRDAWGVHDDIVLKKLFDLYGANWTLIAQVFNSATAVSRFVCKKRSPRQCYDRYGKIISGSISTSATAPGVTTATSKDSKSSASLKAQRAAAASVAAAQLTPVVLDARIGLPHTELLLTFPLRHSLPGLPPPSIMGATSLVEMTLALRKKQTAVDAADKKGTSTTQGGGLDDLKSIKTSFDAIIQCMKHKTSPPPIPIPVGTGSTGAASTTATTSAIATADSADLGTKASLTAASTPPIQVPVTVSTTPTEANAMKASVSPVVAAKATPVVVPPPHKSHTDMISLLPTAVLGPDEVIKRSKEAAVVAVQAAAAVASVGRDGSPLSASADVMLGAGSGFGASVSGSMPRRSHAASLSSEMSTVGVMAPSALPPTVVGAGAASSGAPPQSSGASDAAAWGGELVHGLDTNGLSAGTPMNTSGEASVAGASGSELPRNGPMPVTTSTLLHVLDRMPEIKNKIQSILNRTDCSESQKVAMIARLLSNTNAINNTNALGAAPPMTSAAATATSSVVLSALTDATMLNSSDMLIDTETPIPMPASLGAPSPPNVATSSAVASQGQFQPPASSQP